MLRKRKLQIYIDDDGLPGGDTHHYQLARAFRSIGANLPLGDDEFGELDELCRHLDPATANFVQLTKTLYSRSLGAWCVVEYMSDDWMRALAEALSVHHPDIVAQPYFAECFAGHVEERHAAEALEVTRIVLRSRPYLMRQTLRDAETMAGALDGVWADNVIRGGSWGESLMARTSGRYQMAFTRVAPNVGFRCALQVDTAPL